MIQVAQGQPLPEVKLPAWAKKAAKAGRDAGVLAAAGVGAGALAALTVAYGAGVLVYAATHGVMQWVTANLVPEVYEPAVKHGTRDLRVKVEELEERVARLEGSA